MHNKATFRAAVLGLLGAAVMLAQDAPLPTGSINLNLPTTGPVAVAKMSNDSRLSARGAALVLDLHMALQLRNVSTKSINGLTLRVVSQEVALGGKNSVSYPALNVAPGEVFPAHIDMQVIRPSQAAAGQLVEVSLDGVLFQDLSFFGPDKLDSRRTLTAAEMEAQRDREYFKRVLAVGGRKGLQDQMVQSLNRQDSMPQLRVRVRQAGGRSVTSAAISVTPQEHAEKIACLKFPDSPVEALEGWAQVSNNEARAPSVEVHNLSRQQVKYVEMGWILSDPAGHNYLAGSLPADRTFYLPPGEKGRITQESTLNFSSNSQPVSVHGMTSFVSQVQFADGKVWVPNRQDLEDPVLRQVLPPSAEELRLTNLYLKKGVEGLIEELKKF
jgi:hypothetical protein